MNDLLKAVSISILGLYFAANWRCCNDSCFSLQVQIALSESPILERSSFTALCPVKTPASSLSWFYCTSTLLYPFLCSSETIWRASDLWLFAGTDRVFFSAAIISVSDCSCWYACGWFRSTICGCRSLLRYSPSHVSWYSKFICLPSLFRIMAQLCTCSNYIFRDRNALTVV